MRNREARAILTGRGIASVLRQQRRNLRLTQKQMAEKTGLSQGRIAEFEGGSRRFPSAKTLALLAAGYELAHPLVLGLHFARRIRTLEQRLARTREDLIGALIFGEQRDG